jgi:hypothetical protein
LPVAHSSRIRLSATPPFGGYSGSTTVVSSFTHSIGAFSEGTWDIQFWVPANMAYGTYYLYLDMDYPGSINELNEGDNSTVSAMRVNVLCG